MKTITQDELLDALKKALAKPGTDKGQSVADLMDTMGCGERKVRILLRRVSREGRLEVGRAQRQAIDGRLGTVPVYRIKAKAK